MKKVSAFLLALIMILGIWTFGPVYAWNSGSGTTTMPSLLPGKTVVPAGMPENLDPDYMYPFNDTRLLGKPEKNKLPAMGWNSWNPFESYIDENKIKAIADSFIRLGLDECGYEYVVIDDGCYQGQQRTSDGKLQHHLTNFPSGFKAMGDYVHSLGLKYGMYNNAATRTCGGQSGSWGYEDVDAASFAEWGLDYLKYDFCSNPWSVADYRHTPYIRSITINDVNYNAYDDGIVKGSARKVNAASEGVISDSNGNYVDTIGTHDATYRAEDSTGPDFYGDLYFNITAPADGIYDVGIEMRVATAVAMPQDTLIAGTSVRLADKGQPDSNRMHYNGRSLQLDVNGVRQLNEQYTTNTGGEAGSFETKTYPLNLKAGNNEIRIYTRKMWENNLMSMAAMYDGLQKAYTAADKEVPILSLCEWGQGYPWLGWGRKVGDSWRISSDITNRVGRGQFNTSWPTDASDNTSIRVRSRSSVVWEYNQNVILDEYAGLDKGWNDPDMMMVGLRNDNDPKEGYTYAAAGNTLADIDKFNPFSFIQDKSHFSSWCMMNAPLMLGNDLREVEVGDDVHKVITNKDVIALNQDPLGIQAKRIYNSANSDPSIYSVERDRIDVLAKPLANGDVALMFFNVSPTETLTASVTIDDIMDFIGHKLAVGSKFGENVNYRVKDLWTKQNTSIGRNANISYTVGSEDSVTIRLAPIDKLDREISSPGGRVKATYAFNESTGVFSYSVTSGGTQMIVPSNVGIVTSLGDFRTGLTYIGTEIRTVKDEYELKGAKVSQVIVEGVETVFSFLKDGVQYDIITRAYDDGFALRYKVHGQEGQTFTISAEHTEVRMPSVGFEAWQQGYNADNEWPYNRATSTGTSISYSLPYLYHTGTAPNDKYALVSEAALNGNYCGARLTYGGVALSVKFSFATGQTSAVTSAFPFESPWRFIVMGNLGDITLNTMAETLSPACEFDASWVETGITNWSWLNGDLRHDQIPAGTFEQKGLEIYKKYIDFAADMGWDFTLLDEGWQIRNTSANQNTEVFGDKYPAYQSGAGTYLGHYKWTGELLEYAKEKGVRVLVWVRWDDLNTPVKRERLDYWASLGIAGIKADFFSNDSQARIQVVDAIIEKCVENKLLINMHGITKTHGERRTYPNFLTREGVRGAEAIAVDDMRATNNYGGGASPWGVNVTASHNIMQFYTRNSVGPMDYTPMAGYGANNNVRYGPQVGGTADANPRQVFWNPPLFTLAHMAAMPVVYEGGIQCLADKWEIYLASPGYERFWRSMPTEWDESVFIDGYIGSYNPTGGNASLANQEAYVNMARRSGDEWYVGMMSSYRTNTDKSFKLDFLGEGDYVAYIYKDYLDPDDIKAPSKKIAEEIRIVDKNDTLTLTLAGYEAPVETIEFTHSTATTRTGYYVGGGAAIRFVPVEQDDIIATRLKATDADNIVNNVKVMLDAEGKILNGSVEFVRVKEGEKAVALYAALYDANGKLTNFTGANETIQSGTGLRFSVDIEVPDDTTGMSYQLFIWDGVTFVPITYPVKI